MFVNVLAGRIANGESDVALIVGGEALRTQVRAEKAGLKLDWSEDAPSDPAPCGEETRYASAHEIGHGIALPTSVYPLFENAFYAVGFPITMLMGFLVILMDIGSHGPIWQAQLTETFNAINRLLAGG